VGDRLARLEREESTSGTAHWPRALIGCAAVDEGHWTPSRLVAPDYAAAFEGACLAHFPSLHRYVLGLTRSTDEADDITAEVFARDGDFGRRIPPRSPRSIARSGGYSGRLTTLGDSLGRSIRWRRPARARGW
jgi:hypothetical protein